MVGRDDARQRRSGGAGLLALTVTVLSATAGPLWAGERQVADGGAPWCQSATSFEPYIEALLAGDRAKLATLHDCNWLNAGVVVDVLADDQAAGPRSHVVQVRVFGHGPSQDGYTLSNMIEDFHRPDGGSGSRR